MAPHWAYRQESAGQTAEGFASDIHVDLAPQGKGMPETDERLLPTCRLWDLAER
jgi:hypothetical protein